MSIFCNHERLTKDKTAFPHSAKAGKPAVLLSKLAGSDAVEAYNAILGLAQSEQAVPHLKRKLSELQAYSKIRPKSIDKFIADLDSPVFAVRQKATKELEKLAWFDTSLLQQALQDRNVSQEARARIKSVEKSLSRRKIFVHRMLEVLELIGNSEAIDLLEKGAKTFPPEFAIEANGSLKRLMKKRQSQ